LKLREAAIKIMDGRKWTDGPVSINFTIYAPALGKGRVLSDYLEGIEDTLEGATACCLSHGFVTSQA
jgi:hypothetical protein